MIVGTAGHIDHGKTTLVRALTGVNTDRLPEEKRRGITIELGFAPLDLEGIGTVGIVDVPGHEGFVRTMVAGATGVDAGLIVIAADEGVMPQTREHVAILSLLGMQSAVVALTKADAVDQDWLQLVEEDVRSFLADTPFAAAPIVATSARTGQGISELRTALRLVLEEGPLRSSEDVFRMPIDRAFTVKGTGTVVTGTVWSGRAKGSSGLTLYPGSVPVRIRALHAHGVSVDSVECATRAAIALGGLDLEHVGRGAVLVEGGGWTESMHLHAEVALVGGDLAPVRPREWLRFHLGTAEEDCRVVAVGDQSEFGAGARRLCRVVFARPVVARAGDRFVLRRAQPMTTIGGGIVLDPAPPTRRARPTAPWVSDHEKRAHMLLSEAGVRGATPAELAVRGGLSPRQIAECKRAMEVTVVGDRMYLMSILTKTSESIVNSVIGFHSSYPLEPFAAVTSLRAAHPIDDSIFSACLALAVEKGSLEACAGGYRVPGFMPVISPAVEKAESVILARLREKPLEPPSVSELEAHAGGTGVMPILRLLARRGAVVAVEPDRYYDAGALEGVLATLRSVMSDGSGKTPAQLREALGMSRKYLIPLLEYCDRHRITERRGDSRVLAS